MSNFKTFFHSIGLNRKIEIKRPYNYNIKDYDSAKKEKLILHKTYLKDIEIEETNRLNVIENKTSQIISQTGLIFALLSLFVPFIIDKLLDFNLYVKLIFTVLLALSYLLYILTITNALKNFNVKNFNYSKSSPKSVIDKNNLNVKDFIKMEVKDLLFSINNNIAVNNIKATNLITAFNAFRFGNISTSILVVFLCASLLFLNSSPDEIRIKDSIEIKHFEEYIETLKTQNELLKEQNLNRINDTIANSTTGNNV